MAVLHQKRDEQVGETRPVEEPQAAPKQHANSPGMARLQALIQAGQPSPREVAGILEAHPTEQAAIAERLQQSFGNHFTSQVFQATRQPAEAEPVAVPAHDGLADAPLGAPTEADPAQVAADEVARGADDENKITNEVFWQRHPALRNIKLKAGSPAAQEWLRLRNADVRPLLDRKTTPKPAEARPVKPAVAEVPTLEPANVPAPAPPTLEAKVPGPQLAKQVVEHAEAAPKTQPAPLIDPQPTANTNTTQKQPTDPAVAALLAWSPSGVGGEKGQAAWLLAAIETKLIGAFPQTKEQLKRLAEGHDTVMSNEQDPDEFRSPAKNVKRVGDGGKGHGIYSIAMADTPILGVLCTLGSSRIQQWIDEGEAKVKMLFQLGTMARGDMGFGYHSRHAQGSAIDIAFADNNKSFSSEKDVIDLLDGLEPGQIGSVFPDNDNHIHLAVNGGKYEIGLPFQGPFFPKEKSLATAKKAAEKKAPANPEVGQTIEATGMDVYNTSFTNKAVAKYGEWQGVTKWWWGRTTPGSAADARSTLKSAKLKELLDKLGAGGNGPVPTAKAQDGHSDDTEDPQPTAPKQGPAAPKQEPADAAKTVGANVDAAMTKQDKHDAEKCEGNCGHDHGGQLTPG